MGLVEFWAVGGLTTAGVVFWARYLAKRPGASRHLSWLSWAPASIWALSVIASAFFLWRARQHGGIPADERALFLVTQIAWAMRVALVGAGAVALAASWLGIMALIGPGKGSEGQGGKKRRS